MTIAQELEDRMWTLADPAVEWVHHEPSQPGQACLICDFAWEWLMSPTTEGWLNRFVDEYAAGSEGGVMWNDHPNRTLDQVLWMLEEAVDQAKAEGV